MHFNKEFFRPYGLEGVYEKIIAGERLDGRDGLRLFECPNPVAVGALAAHVRHRKHGNIASYVVNRQINYTNVCVNRCVFCAFRRDHANEAGAFVLGHDEIIAKIGQACGLGAGLDELHMVGGCHPDLGLAWFTELLTKIGRLWPDLPVKAFTPVEIAHFARLEGISTAETLKILKDSGLKMMPGGGAEIFDENLRSALCPEKADAETWLRISGEAHKLGIKTNCTMLFGHLESLGQRVDHLLRLRRQQDVSGGFTCFILLPFLRANNRLKLPAEKQTQADGPDKLRTIAVARLLLDNIDHIKAYWVMLGPKMAQSALAYGADDFDGTIIEERIGHMAGADSARGLTIRQLENMIRESGFRPVRRNAVFSPVNTEGTRI